jgi:hypothetical protein
MRTDWTGTILDQVGTAHLQTFSTDEPPAPIFPAPHPPGIPPQLAQPSSSDLDTLESTEAFAGSASHSSISISSDTSIPSLSSNDLAYLSVLFEGGAESVTETPYKENKQKHLNFIYKSETNSLKHLSEVQQASVMEQALMTVSEVKEKDPYLLLNLNPKQMQNLQSQINYEIEETAEQFPLTQLRAEDCIPEPINEFALLRMPEGKIKNEWIHKSILELQGLVKENQLEAYTK